MATTSDVQFVQRYTKTLILDLMEEGYGYQDIIEGIEEELDRFESLVFDNYE